jgi:hypothetical protein
VIVRYVTNGTERCCGEIGKDPRCDDVARPRTALAWETIEILAYLTIAGTAVAFAANAGRS